MTTSTIVWVPTVGEELGALKLGATLVRNIASRSRRPRIRARWLREVGHPHEPPREGLAVAITGGRRPIEVHEVGLRVRFGPRRKLRRRRAFEMQIDAPSTDKSVPVRLEDGDMLHFGWELSHLIDELHAEIGDDRITAQLRVFVRGSGVEYRARIKH